MPIAHPFNPPEPPWAALASDASGVHSHTKPQRRLALALLWAWARAISKGVSLTAVAALTVSQAHAQPTHEFRQRIKGLQVTPAATATPVPSPPGDALSGSTPEPPHGPAPVGLVQFEAYRAWANGNLATSCAAYRQPEAGYAYSGATGDGTYRVLSNEGAVDVYCDMSTDGGGWTLVMRGNPQALPSDWSVWTLPDAVEPQSLALAQGGTAKWSDATINGWAQQAFRVQGAVNGVPVATRYFSADCQLDMSALPVGACAVSFADAALSSGRRERYDPEDRGANHRGLGDYVVYTLRPDPLVRSLHFTLGLPNSSLWFVGTGLPDEFESALGNVATTPMEGPASFELFVK